MIKTFTQHDLVQYLYNELPSQRQQQLEETLMADQELAESCADLLVAKISLEGLSFEPSDRVTNAIINYSKNVSLHP